MFLHENALNTARVPVAGAHPVRRRALDRRPAARAGRPPPASSRAAAPSRSSAPCWRRASGAASSAASRRRRSCSPRAPTPRSTSRPTCSACARSRRRCATTGRPTSTRWPPPSGRTRCSSSARRRSTRRASSTRSRRSPSWPPRVDANCHVDACMGGFVLPFAERLGRDVPPWDFRVDGRALDLGRRPQARLRAEGRVGDPPPHEGAAALPDVRVRRLARRAVRVAEPAGHAVGRADGGGVGRDAPPRHRRLRRADAPARSTPPTGCAPASRAIDGVRVLGDGTFHCRGDGRRRAAASTCSPSATLLHGRGWHLDRQGPPDSLHATVSQGNAATMDAFLADLAHRRRRRHHDRRPHDPLRDPGVAPSECSRHRSVGGGDPARNTPMTETLGWV